MNTSNLILAAKANSGKSTNNVWVVYTSDNSSDKMYCTSAYKAMRLAFLLKKRLGLNISDINPAKRNVLDLKNETCKNREKRNVLKISHTRHFKTTKKQSKTGCFYSF